MTKIDDYRRPIDVADTPGDDGFCSCGRRIWGHDRIEFAAAWYEHLLAMLHSDPEGNHTLHAPF
jgi:hypothetical protein